MKYFKISVVVCALLTLFPLKQLAQNAIKIDINAIVSGADGAPIQGAVVYCKPDDVSATTGADGAFAISASLNAPLTVNAIGFKTKAVAAVPDLKNITLEEDIETVQVAFRKVKKSDLLVGVSSVNVKEIIKKNFSTYSLDGMSALTNSSNWGNGSYLLLVDGVPRASGNVNMDEVDQVSFLKGASAVALYGSRAAKGVVYITTKRGEANTQEISVRANTGMNFPKAYPKYLGSAEYMTLYNEARVNDGLTPLYSDESIYHHASGENPFRYPDVDFFSSDYLKKAYNYTVVSTEVKGGGERARYYSNFGFANSGGLLNFGEAIENSGNNRFNVRGNIDVDLNDYLSCYVDANVIFYTGRGVNANYWAESATLRPNRFSPLVPIDMIEADDASSNDFVKNSNYIIDGKYMLGGSSLHQTNPFAAIYAGGYNRYNSRQFQFKTGVNADLNNVLEGLSFNTMIAVDYSNTYSLAYNYQYAVYEPTWSNYQGGDLIASLTKYGKDATSGNQNVSGSWYSQTIALSGQFNYLRSFNDVHNVSGTLVAAGFQVGESGIYHKTANANMGLQLGYNFMNKYYFDFSGALIHSAKMPENNRKAFSPTVSLGWRLSEEAFMDNVSAIDDLKLSVSAGIIHTDLDVANYYMYQGYYTYKDAGYYGWKDGTGVQSFDRRLGSNPNMKFPKREEISLGLDGSFFNRLITLNGSLFATRTTGNLVQSYVDYPSYFSTGYPQYSEVPYVNYNDDQRIGADFYVTLNKKIGQVDWSLGVSGMVFDSEALKRSENYEFEYQNDAGKPLDALWGLKSDGFFKDADDIAASDYQTFGQVKPGDIKYIDQNNDGLIDSKDAVYLGKAGWYGSPFSMGVNLTVKWKNFTFFAMGTGRYGAHAFKSGSYYWVDGDDKYSEVVRDRWTEQTKDSAKYPRLTTLTSDNNFRNSDFWLYSTDRFDLEKVQVTYKLPQSLLSRTFISDMDVYVAGYDLLTIAPEREILERNVGSAPQTRFYNVGLKATF
ncbi:TonB-linked SusC/RagA family outer membrane protein [Breznakibacter xylanolyticus]|uniref:TonB-linked SusC/RagA family outer membrane protein n=1 Tax=Breznakibacter xylanolyticus TaxID=990 RepID=A0A2W7NAW5_9BACT|nr:SusC/RagA family TonB-linked outer membrane protein [Breznakibacter xylanolyticus]PZX17248.1 TonB-linked SusC/RagA family outer membrane protein [Breznakibacter xylanolyticus]